MEKIFISSLCYWERGNATWATYRIQNLLFIPQAGLASSDQGRMTFWLAPAGRDSNDWYQ